MNARSCAVAVALVAAGSLVAACGGDDPEDAAPVAPADAPADDTAGDAAATITLIADGVRWDQDELSAPLGTVTFVIDNQDSGVPHNLRVTGNGLDEATELESGVVEQRLEVTFTEAGTYDYICDIHPNMDGTIEVR